VDPDLGRFVGPGTESGSKRGARPRHRRPPAQRWPWTAAQVAVSDTAPPPPPGRESWIPDAHADLPGQPGPRSLHPNHPSGPQPSLPSIDRRPGNDQGPGNDRHPGNDRQPGSDRQPASDRRPGNDRQPGSEPGPEPAAAPRGRTAPRRRATPRQLVTARVAIAATTALFLFAAAAGATEIALHGFAFFVFRSAGTGETGRVGGLTEDQGPGQPNAPKPTPSLAKVRPRPHAAVTVHPANSR
jgi:hypothetical protein